MLDRSLTREGTPPQQVLRETVAFAREAERLGYHRFWVSEHHAVPGVAGSAPTVLAAAVAAATSRIRVGTGGVMLPNHQPLVVAEQFGVLESLHPGRIDMGLGRSTGFTEPVRRALRTGKDAADRFGDQLDELLAYFDAAAPLPALPAGGLRVPAYVLAVGSGAQLAAERGLPVVLPARRESERTAAAVAEYRSRFRPSRRAEEPHVVLAVNAAAAATRERASLLQRPEARSTAVSRTRGVFPPLVPAEEVDESAMGRQEHRRYTEAREGQLHGTAEEVTAALSALAAATEADELLLTLNTYDPADRLDSYRRLAHAAGLPGPASGPGG